MAPYLPPLASLAWFGESLWRRIASPLVAGASHGPLARGLLWRRGRCHARAGVAPPWYCPAQAARALRRVLHVPRECSGARDPVRPAAKGVSQGGRSARPRQPQDLRAGLGRRGSPDSPAARRRAERAHVGHGGPGARPATRRHRPAGPRPLGRRGSRGSGHDGPGLRGGRRSTRHRRPRALGRDRRGHELWWADGYRAEPAAAGPGAEAGAGRCDARRHARQGRAHLGLHPQRRLLRLV